MLPPEPSHTLVLRIQALDEHGNQEDMFDCKVPLPSPARGRWRGHQEFVTQAGRYQREAQTESAAGNEPGGREDQADTE